MRSDPVLKSWYKKINKKFFDDQLTNNVCVRWANATEEGDKRWEEKYFGAAKRCEDGKHEYEIIMSREMNKPAATRFTTLAHEMCHIASGLRDDHGPAFSVWHETLTIKGFFTKGAVRKGFTIF